MQEFVSGEQNTMRGRTDMLDFHNLWSGYFFESHYACHATFTVYFHGVSASFPPPRGGGDSLIWAILGMCGLKGYDFSAVLVINRVSILADFGHFGHKKGMVFEL